MHLRLFSRRVALAVSGVILTTVPAVADYLAPSLGPNFFDSSVRRYDAEGQELTAGSIPSFTAGLGFSQGITIGPDGNIYVSSNNLSTGAGEILFFDPAGTPLSHEEGTPGLFATLPFNPPAEEGGDPTAPSPARLTFGPDGNLYVADREGTTVRVFDGTTGMQLADAATDLTTPTGVAFGPDGALYVSNFDLGSVDRIANGVKTPFITQNKQVPDTPTSLLWLQSGNLLVVDVIGNQVLEYDGSGNFVKQFAVPPPPIPDPLPEGVNFPTNSPSDIIIDEHGNLVLGLLGLTFPPDNRGALLRYSLDGGDPIDTIATDLYGVTALAFLPAADAVAGDYDGNGSVGPEDYTQWRADFGKWVAKGGGADGNSDGIVDAADYVYWRNIFSNGGGSNSTAVPEPGSLMLLGISTFMLQVARRKRLSR